MSGSEFIVLLQFRPAFVRMGGRDEVTIERAHVGVGVAA
jgi:hypothetical protein